MKSLWDPEAPSVEGGVDRQRPSCPYLQRAKQIRRYAIEGYCLASRKGGLRVVTVEEFRELCTTAEHACCELYLRHCERQAAERDLESGEA